MYVDDIDREILNLKQKQWIEKYGFYIHYVFSTKTTEMANIHTHGLADNKNHMDFQIVLPITKELASSLIWEFVHNINLGKKYETGLIDGIIANYPVKLITATESGRLVLRIILPDPNGKFPEDEGCDPIYARQADISFSD